MLRVATGGGLVPRDFLVTAQPDLLLLGDGTVLTPAPGAGGGQFVPMLQGRLEEDDVQQLLAAADGAGLLGKPQSYDPAGDITIADAPTTSVSVTADGETHDVSAYALGIGAPEGDTPERERLADFVALAQTAAADAATEPADVDQVRVQVTPHVGQGTIVDWPVADLDLATLGECAVLEGEAADQVAAVLGGLDGPTWFSQDGRPWQVIGSLVLPGSDAPCGTTS